MIYEISIWRILIVTVATLLLGGVTVNSLNTDKQKTFFLLSLAGLYFYSGFGSAYSDYVSQSYLFYYVGFLVVYCMSFVFVSKAAKGISSRLSESTSYKIERLFANGSFGQGAIFTYLMLSLFPLLYPNFNIDRLWNLPGFDIRMSWFYGLPPGKSVMELAILNVRFLVLPFYLIGLYRYRQKIITLVVLICLPYYFEYCANGYLGRTILAYILGLLLIFLWHEQPKYRTKIILYSFVLSPFVLFLLTIWSASRTGELVLNFSIIPIVETLQKETGFPILGEKVISGDLHTNLSDYFMWMLALPLPKILVGPKPMCLMTVEITEIVERIPLGYHGFSITLTGPVTESVYIYGSNWFWLHGIFVGFLAGFLCSLTESIRSAVFVYAYFIVAFSFVFARAGIGGLMPIVMNQFLSFYLILFIITAVRLSVK